MMVDMPGASVSSRYLNVNHIRVYCCKHVQMTLWHDSHVLISLEVVDGTPEKSCSSDDIITAKRCLIRASRPVQVTLNLPIQLSAGLDLLVYSAALCLQLYRCASIDGLSVSEMRP